MNKMCLALHGQLPGGYTNNQPKMSASQLAAAQAAAATNAKNDHSLANDVTQVVGSKVTQADAAAVQSSLGQQVGLHTSGQPVMSHNPPNQEPPLSLAVASNHLPACQIYSKSSRV